MFSLLQRSHPVASFEHASFRVPDLISIQYLNQVATSLRHPSQLRCFGFVADCTSADDISSIDPQALGSKLRENQEVIESCHVLIENIPELSPSG